MHWVYRDGDHMTLPPLCRQVGWVSLIRAFGPPVRPCCSPSGVAASPPGTLAKGCARSCAGLGGRACDCRRQGPGARLIVEQPGFVRVPETRAVSRGRRHVRHQVWLRPILGAADNAMVHRPRMRCICRTLGPGSDTRRSVPPTPPRQPLAHCRTSIINRTRESAHVPIRAVRAYCRPLVAVQSPGPIFPGR